MTKKIFMGILFVSLLLLMSLVFAKERFSTEATVGNVGPGQKSCDCSGKDSIASLSDSSDVLLAEQPTGRDKECVWSCDYRCYFWAGPECIWWVSDCIMVCPPNNPRHK